MQTNAARKRALAKDHKTKKHIFTNQRKALVIRKR